MKAHKLSEFGLKQVLPTHPINKINPEVRAVAALRFKRQSIFELPPQEIGDDSKFEKVNPDHPLAASNRFARQDAADFFKRLAEAKPELFDDDLLNELHEALFDRDAAVRLAITETLTILRRSESLEYLRRLRDGEDESDWVKNAVAIALEHCSR